MISAQEAKALTGTDKLDEIRKSYEKDIQQAAQRGEHYCLLDYCDCCDGNNHLVMEELKQNGFYIYTQSEIHGGFRQCRGYYARW